MSKTINYQNSMNDVVSTIGPVLQNFIEDVLKNEITNLKVVHSPNMDYVNAIKDFRRKAQMEDVVSEALPLFVFRRSVLRWQEDGLSPNRRLTSSTGSVKDIESGTAVTYTPIFGEFDLDFLYINTSMEETEKFEITYLSDEGISGTRQFKVELPILGEFTFFADYSNLESLDVVAEDNFYKALAGVIKIRGMFFTFRSESAIIRSIELNYKAWLDENTYTNLETINITGVNNGN